MTATNVNDSAQWRKILQPLIAALVALAGAATVYVKTHSEINDSHDAAVRFNALVEARLTSLESRMQKSERDAEILKATLGDMRSDLSFIRGTLERGRR